MLLILLIPHLRIYPSEIVIIPSYAIIDITNHLAYGIVSESCYRQRCNPASGLRLIVLMEQSQKSMSNLYRGHTNPLCNNYPWTWIIRAIADKSAIYIWLCICMTV